MALVVYLVLAVAIGSAARLGLTAWRPARFTRRYAASTLAALLFMLLVSRGMSYTTAAQWVWLVALAATAFAAAATALNWARPAGSAGSD